MKRENIIIGARGSKLAIIYAEKVKNELSKVFSGNIDIKKIITSGDQNQKDRLSSLGGKGLFSTNIENELKQSKIDLAVHALKDMPSVETIGLKTNCFLKRNSPNEILISKNKKFLDLEKGSVVGTSSFRREYQLRNIRSDLNYKLIRGNVDTRIKKLENNEYDAIISVTPEHDGDPDEVNRAMDILAQHLTTHTAPTQLHIDMMSSVVREVLGDEAADVYEETLE